MTWKMTRGFCKLLKLCKIRNQVLSLGLLLFSSLATANQNEPEEIITGLGVPWGMAFLDHKQLLITERRGNLVLANIENGSIKRFKFTLPISTRGQGGLLDIRTDLRFADNQMLYFSYSKPTPKGVTTAIASASWVKDKLVGLKDIFVAEASSNTNRHFGSRIQLHPAGHIYLSIGDRGIRPNGQNLSNHAGTIIRVMLNGNPPEDNPFYNQPSAKPEIWSYGHRNPQGLAFTSDYQKLWSIEHGPRGGDEINLISAGGNYGWAEASYGKEYHNSRPVGKQQKHAPKYIAPSKVYDPSIAPSGLVAYSGKLNPKWKNHLFSGALKGTHINHIGIDQNNKVIFEKRYLASYGQRVRNIIEGPNGYLYVALDDGIILKLDPKNCCIN